MSRVTVQDWLFDVHLRVVESVNTMSSRNNPAAVAAPAAVARWKRPVKEYVNTALVPANTPCWVLFAVNEPFDLIAAFKIPR